MDKTCHHCTCKLHTFCNISDLKNNCFCQILFSLTYISANHKGTDIGKCDAIKSNESPRGEDEGDYLMIFIILSINCVKRHLDQIKGIGLDCNLIHKNDT